MGEEFAWGRGIGCLGLKLCGMVFMGETLGGGITRSSGWECCEVFGLGELQGLRVGV